jgi:hypothetical protein
MKKWYKLQGGHLVQVLPPELICFQVKPDRSARNWRSADLAAAVAELRRPRFSHLKLQGFRLQVQLPEVVTFESYFTPDSICFYIIGPRRLASYLKARAESVWDKATVQQAALPPSLDPANSCCAWLEYKRHDLFSLNTDARTNTPLPSLLAAARELQPGDKAHLQALFEPVNRVEWELRAGQAYDLLRKGAMPRRPALTKSSLLREVALLFCGLMNEAAQLLTDFVAPGPSSSHGEPAKARRVIDPEARLTMVKGLADPAKPTSAALRATVRLAVESQDEGRAMVCLHSMAGAFKELTADNELDRRDVPPGRREAFINGMALRRPPLISVNGSTLSIREAGKFMQVPTAELQRDFPAVECINRREVALPDELFMPGGIPLANVTERGTTRLAQIPTAAYPGAPLKIVYDALCTGSFGQGKMGTGKTAGYGGNWALGMVKAGFTTFVIDTADGQGIKDLEDALPADYPDEKLVHLALDVKAWPLALNHSDILGGQPKAAGGDAELEALEIAERMTSRMREFIASRSISGEFTERMEQYLGSCMQAVTAARPHWDFLDIELALRSPAYRDELLQHPGVQAQLGAVRDLEDLQEKAARGVDSSVIDPILARIKMLTNSKFSENLFFQAPKLGAGGQPVINFRRWMDNKPQGVPGDKYGYLVAIHASSDAWGEDGQGLVLGFIEDKINFAALSRVDTDQAQRRPCAVWIDEPHKIIKSTARYYAQAAVEFRKYRVKRIYTGHSIEQMGAAAKALLEGGAQVTSYKTEAISDLARFSHLFKPYEDPAELYEMLPDKWVAINKVRLPAAGDVPAFIGHMLPPPPAVKSREARRQQCAQQYGRHWKEVTAAIQARRQRYYLADAAWQKARELARQAAKAKAKK